MGVSGQFSDHHNKESGMTGEPKRRESKAGYVNGNRDFITQKRLKEGPKRGRGREGRSEGGAN